jgi:hypothetical protein
MESGFSNPISNSHRNLLLRASLAQTGSLAAALALAPTAMVHAYSVLPTPPATQDQGV